MIEEISVTFDFGKLLRNLDKIIVKDLDRRKNELAVNAKQTITKGKLRQLKPFTKMIRKKGLSGKAKGVKSGGTTPLLYTGKLLNSIKVNKEGVEMKEYGWYHQKGFKVVSNSWTDRFLFHKKKSFGGKIASFMTTGLTYSPIDVKARPFLFTRADRLPPEVKKRYKILEKDLYKQIHRFLTR